jgi:hypothetical protein
MSWVAGCAAAIDRGPEAARTSSTMTPHGCLHFSATTPLRVVMAVRRRRAVHDEAGAS